MELNFTFFLFCVNSLFGLFNYLFYNMIYWSIVGFLVYFKVYLTAFDFILVSFVDVLAISADIFCLHPVVTGQFRPFPV